jgi:hypothetical protein
MTGTTIKPQGEPQTSGTESIKESPKEEAVVSKQAVEKEEISKETEAHMKKEETPKRKDEVQTEAEAPKKEEEVPKEAEAPKKEEEVPMEAEVPKKEEEVPMEAEAPKKEEVSNKIDVPKREEEVSSEGKSPKEEVSTTDDSGTHTELNGKRKGVEVSPDVLPKKQRIDTSLENVTEPVPQVEKASSNNADTKQQVAECNLDTSEVPVKSTSV